MRPILNALAFLGLLVGLVSPAAAVNGVRGYYWGTTGTAACTSPSFSVGDQPPSACGASVCAGVVPGPAASGDQRWFSCVGPTGNVITAQYVLRQPACKPEGGGSTVYTTISARDADCVQTDNACTSRAGTGGFQNFTVAWSRLPGSKTPSDGSLTDLVGTPSFPSGTVCVQGCEATTGAYGAGWQSEEPSSQGLYRVSYDVYVNYTGTTCSGTTTGFDPAASVQPCIGSLGSVNGKPQCVAAVGSTPNSPSGNKVGPGLVGNPTAGSSGSASIGSRSPSGGSGGPEGGPPSAVDGSVRGGGSLPGSGSSGGTQIDVEVETCGLPGKPACKIDESGTPNGAGAYGDATNAVNANKDTAVQGINDAAAASGKATAWTFTFAFPTGCTAIAMPGFEALSGGIDICAWQGMIHDLMSMIWLAVTVWCCIGMVGRAVGGGGA